MTPPTLSDWADHLASLAADPGADPSRLDAAPSAFLAWRNPAARSDPPRAATPEKPRAVDEILWEALVDARIPDRHFADLVGTAGDAPSSLEAPLHEQAPSESIEVWTERELSALHALLWLAERRARSDWSERLRACAVWHVEHTQPDNATNRPWALHVFLILARERDAADARLYAETLLHNCLISMGRPDALSAMILADAADALRAHQQGA